MDLNIRNTPDELVKRLKVRASADGRTLRDFALEALANSLEKQEIRAEAEEALEEQVTCPLCGLEGPLVKMGANARCWHCGAGFVPAEVEE